MRVIALLLLLACAACTSSHDLTSCRGPFAQANPGKWTAAPGDLAGGAK